MSTTSKSFKSFPFGHDRADWELYSCSQTAVLFTIASQYPYELPLEGDHLPKVLTDRLATLLSKEFMVLSCVTTICGTFNHIHFLFHMPLDFSMSQLLFALKNEVDDYIHSGYPGRGWDGWQAFDGIQMVPFGQILALRRILMNQDLVHRQLPAIDDELHYYRLMLMGQMSHKDALLHEAYELQQMDKLMAQQAKHNNNNNNNL